MFGDILSDEAAVLVGSLGLLPSASLGEARACSSRFTICAGHSPAATLPTRSERSPPWPCLLRHGMGLAEPAAAVERAISLALEQGARTRDIAEPAAPALGTRAMGSRIAGLIAEAHRSRASATR